MTMRVVSNFILFAKRMQPARCKNQKHEAICSYVLSAEVRAKPIEPRCLLSDALCCIFRLLKISLRLLFSVESSTSTLLANS